MINVSNSFKKAIKSDNREIYGYVEVDHNKTDYDLSVTTTPTLNEIVLSDGSGIISGKKIMTSYATLENNYTLLDGSFMVWNENVVSDVGLISDNTFENILNTSIIIDNSSSSIGVKGITLYFKDNLPFDFDITFIYSNDTVSIDHVRNNESMVYQKIFTNDIYISQMKLDILTVEHPDNRLRISCIDFNVSDLYYGDELVNFNITEEIDLLLENLPINTCSIKLNNYPNENQGNKFDPINPVGITKYLTSNTEMKPYIGVLTEDNGVEYVPMGVFYIKNWSSDSDGNVSINGENLLGIFRDTTISSDGTFLRNQFTGSTISSYFSNMTGYNFDIFSGTYYNNHLQDTNLLNWLISNMPFQVMYYDSSSQIYEKRKFRITRDNVATEDLLDEFSVDSISRNELKSDVKYETKSVINEVEINDMTNYSMSSTTVANVVQDTYTLKATEEYIWYKLNKYTNYNGSTFSYSSSDGATATLIDKNYYMIYVKVTGDIGDTINITYSGYVYENPPAAKRTWRNNYVTGDKLSLDFTKYFNAEDSALNTTAEYYLTNDKKYKVTMRTIGDPSLESGDTVSVQTRYEDYNEGYKDVIITKQKFTFDGGLSCEIEGVGD